MGLRWMVGSSASEKVVCRHGWFGYENSRRQTFCLHDGNPRLKPADDDNPKSRWVEIAIAVGPPFGVDASDKRKRNVEVLELPDVKFVKRGSATPTILQKYCSAGLRGRKAPASDAKSSASSYSPERCQRGLRQSHQRARAADREKSRHREWRKSRRKHTFHARLPQFRYP